MSSFVSVGNYCGINVLVDVFTLEPDRASNAFRDKLSGITLVQDNVCSRTAHRTLGLP